MKMVIDRGLPSSINYFLEQFLQGDQGTPDDNKNVQIISLRPRGDLDELPLLGPSAAEVQCVDGATIVINGSMAGNKNASIISTIVDK